IKVAKIVGVQTDRVKSLLKSRICMFCPCVSMYAKVAKSKIRHLQSQKEIGFKALRDSFPSFFGFKAKNFSSSCIVPPSLIHPYLRYARSSEKSQLGNHLGQ
ncbi:hypothetical protein KI387_005841, partial [Taxus chinensis]